MTAATTETGPFTCACGKTITRVAAENGWRDEDRDLWCDSGDLHAPAVEDDKRGDSIMTSGMPDLTGADGELGLILNGVYTCARVWEAWDVGTMTEDDFEEAAHSPIVDDLIAWRDAAVASALEAAGKPSAAPAEPSLGGRITTALLEAGFRQRQQDTDPKLAAFAVVESVGATVGVIWAANEEWRGKVLRKIAEALRAAGFIVREREDHLYVPEPKDAE